MIFSSNCSPPPHLHGVGAPQRRFRATTTPLPHNRRLVAAVPRLLLLTALLLAAGQLCPTPAGAHDEHDTLSATIRLPSASSSADAATAHSLLGELALTSTERMVGLMNRPLLDIDAGMLFVFGRSERLSFWMKDTLIALSIAFIDRDGIILNIERMEPLSLTSVPSVGKAQYALEVNQGYFAERGIAAGDQITLADCPSRSALLQHAPQKVVAAVLRLCR